jgi:hypothetical protein
MNPVKYKNKKMTKKEIAIAQNEAMINLYVQFWKRLF